MGWRLPWIALLVILVALMVAAPGLAQEQGAGGAPGESPGYLYLTDRQVDTSGGFNPACYGPEGSPVFSVGEEVPREAGVEKVHTGGEYDSVSCTTIFRYEAEEGFRIGPKAEVTFWVGCDVGGGVYSNSYVDQFSDYAVTLLHEGEQIAEYRGDYNFPLNARLCFGGADPFRLDAPMEIPETVVAAGDTLSVRVTLFNIVSPGDNFYIATGSRETPSALYGAGLPGKLRASLASDLVVDVDDRTSSTGAGNATTYRFTVENIGNRSREVSVSVEGPDDWTAEPRPPVLTVPPNNERVGNLTVVGPRDLGAGAAADYTVKLASGEERVSFGTATTLVPGAGIPAEEVPGIELAEASSASDGSEDAGVLADLGLELVATAVAGVAVFAAKQLLL